LQSIYKCEIDESVVIIEHYTADISIQGLIFEGIHPILLSLQRD